MNIATENANTATGNAVEYVIEVENLTKVFRDFWGRPKARAVNGLNLRIRPGQVFGLLGPNGSGKSTTVKMLLGLLYPTRGRIRVLGESPRSVAIKRRIGYQPEESYLYPYLTAVETLDFFGSLLGLHEQERVQRIKQLLEMVGLGKAGSRTVGEFSKGMARRLALAQALINDPDLVILDEPTAGLDPIACREIKDVIKVLAERGKTVLLCSHLLADVEDVCDSVVVLYGGKICAEGTVAEVLQIQDQTRILAPALSEGVLAELRVLLQSELGENELQIDHPRMSLEQFFLEVVRQAQVGHADTSGAQVGTGVAEFLEAGSGGRPGGARKVLETLVAGEPGESQPEPVETVIAGEQAVSAGQAKLKAERLNQLAGSREAVKRPAEAEVRKPAEAERRRSSDKLRGLLDRDGSQPGE